MTDKRLEAILSIVCLSFLLSACGPSQLPKKPKFLGGESGAASAVTQNEFAVFLSQADQLPEENAGERFAELIVQSQINLMISNRTGSSLADEEDKGYCVMTISGDQKFSEEDAGGDELKLSPNARVIYSAQANSQPEACQNFFRDSIPQERFQENFF